MAIHLVVEADIVDLSNDQPSVSDRFLVDTNVWYWFAYTQASVSVSSWNNYQLADYPNYLQDCLDNESELFHSTLSLSELSHLIERTQSEIFSGRGTCNLKEFRHNYPNERFNVVHEIDTAWKQVESLSAAMPATVDQSCVNAAIKRLQTQKIDGYDLFILESMAAYKIDQVITDDSDYATVPGIRVFTANRNVINAAKNQGKLVVR